jgi:hypothetical protein
LEANTNGKNSDDSYLLKILRLKTRKEGGKKKERGKKSKSKREFKR